MWSLTWTADYPAADNFLGLLLRSGAPSNYGQWSSAEFDRAVADAESAGDSTSARVAFGRAESIRQRDDPVIPLAYSSGWALAREGLLGAGQNGLGIVRIAGLAWSGQ